jgi:hypothetical protein
MLAPWTMAGLIGAMAPNRGGGRQEGLNMKPFRFGIGLRQARSRAEVAEKARRVEALGYDLLSCPII